MKQCVKAAMKRWCSIVVISIGLAALSGCLSTNPVNFESQVRAWVPLGTPAVDAVRIMEYHGFECHHITTNNPFNLTGFDYIDCEKTQVRLHDWYARLVLKDGKVSAYGPINTN